jgi:hypothetical protein
MRKRIMLGIGIVALSLLATAVVLVTAAPRNVVYFDPDDSRAPFCSEDEVEIWANASDFYGGQINLTYDPTCANVTNWERNTINFPLGGWDTLTDGKEWITFSALPPTALLTGEYRVGTLTIHCESEEGCETQFAFIEPSTLLNDLGESVTVNWVNGTFKCIYTSTTTLITPTPTKLATPTPTPSINPIVVETPIHTPRPEQILTIPVTTSPTPAPTPSPTPAASPVTSPTHTPTPTTGGFEAVFAIIVLALSYLSLKRSRVKK